MKIALLQGGGTCPGSNDAHRGLADTAFKAGHTVVVIPQGYKGLITPGQDYGNLLDHEELEGRGIDGLYRKAGAVPGTSRTKPIPVKEDGSIEEGKEGVFNERAEIIRENLTRNHIDILSIVGGDDTLWRGASMLYRHDVLKRLNAAGKLQTVQAVGVSKTIDNDILGTKMTFGALSAAMRGQDFVNDGRVEATINRKVMLIESMGRNSGWLTGAGGERADGILIPEVELSPEQVVEAVRRKIDEWHKKNLVFVVAEGFRVGGNEVHLAGVSGAAAEGTFGHQRLGGVRFVVEQWLNAAGIDTMQMCPGYLYRSGAPTVEDADFAYRLGATAMQAALAGRDGVIAHLPEGSRSLKDPIALMQMAHVRGGRQLDPADYDPETLRFTKPLLLEEERRR